MNSNASLRCPRLYHESEFSHRETALSYFSLFTSVRKRCPHQSEREMKKGNLGCLLLLLRACYAYPTGALLQEGHPLLDRDTFLNDIDGFVLPTNLGGDGGIACSGCVKPSDASPISPSSPLHPTNPFIESSPCPQMFCQRPSSKNPGTNICCPLIRTRNGRIKCPNSCD